MRPSHGPVLLLALIGACTALPIPQPATAPTTAGGDVAAHVVDLTNQQRLRHGLPALAANPRLMEAALIHARQMASRRELAHTIQGAEYPTMQSRLQAVAYAYVRAAENIAWNQRTPQDVVTTWMNSSGHRTNILDPNVTEMGAAMARSVNGEPYWVQVFGRPR